MNPQISVIIPTYNREETLERAILSVAEQEFRDFELIVVDDGSTDGTEEILKPWRSKPWFRSMRTENQGVSAARNRAIKEARGPWIAFLDSDDEWLPNKLQLQWEWVVSSPETCLIHGEEIWIRKGVRVNPMKKHQKKGGDVFEDSLRLCCISPSTALVKKETLEFHNGFREDFPVCEDYDLWLKITSQNSVGFVETPIIKKYGGHEDQLSRKYKAMDYYRILAIDHILSTPLSEEKRSLALVELFKKREILLNGYRKHQNLENFDEIFCIGFRYK